MYTSIIGLEDENEFSPIVQSNRQTEDYLRNSSIDWVIGRNGIYIEPDIEYIPQYIKDGKISNSAGDGLCGYTSRGELAYAYAQMLIGDQHPGQTYNLFGEAISQSTLVDLINERFSLDLSYEALEERHYLVERKKELGEFMGTVIAGIYSGIRNGAFDLPSNFEEAAGRPHISWEDYFDQLEDVV